MREQDPPKTPSERPVTASRQGSRDLDRRKVYVRIADDLRRDIASERYAVGETLPSIADLAVRFGAAKATVEKALGILRDEQLIATRQGSPSVVAARPEQQDAEEPAPEPSEEFVILRAQLQDMREALRHLGVRLDEIDERTRHLKSER